ncbi:hypothetical protein SHO565_35990 [Streptomyces sp. HO565]
MHAAAGVETAAEPGPARTAVRRGPGHDGRLRGLPGVRAWYETEVTGDPLALLHGGFCTDDTWGAQRANLAAEYRLFLPERRAHGHTPDVEGPLTCQDMAGDTVAFLGTVVRERPIRSAGPTRVRAPALALVGDDDMMTLGHTTTLYRALPESQPAVVPGAPTWRRWSGRPSSPG